MSIGDVCDVAPQRGQLESELLDPSAHDRSHLDLGTHELRAHLTLGRLTDLFEHPCGEIPDEVTGLEIDDLVFLFHADGERRALHDR